MTLSIDKLKITYLKLGRCHEKSFKMKYYQFKTINNQFYKNKNAG